LETWVERKSSCIFATLMGREVAAALGSLMPIDRKF
jgi:hypothetical protein